MKTLIISNTKDVHAVVVACALQSIGVHVVLWSGPVFAGDKTASIFLETRGSHITINDRVYQSTEFDLIWCRRLLDCEVSDSVLEQDKDFIIYENNAFFKNLWKICDTQTKWLPNMSFYEGSLSKISQLKIAAEIGFKIPKTLISNDPDKIRAFLADNNNSHIYKAFKATSWNDDDPYRPKIIYTSRVVASDLDCSDVKVVPGIYQERVDKAFEVRANIFGTREVSARIDAVLYADGYDDWRCCSNLNKSLSSYTLPTEIKDLSLAFMRKAGIDMGCFDFAVTPYNEFYFLEVNRQGQFLWIEDNVPESKTLHEFIMFLLTYSGKYKNKQLSGIVSSELRLRDIEQSELFAKVTTLFERTGYVDFGSDV